MVQDFEMEVSRMEHSVPIVTVRRGEDDASWFNGDFRRAFELKQASYHRWCSNRTALSWNLFCQERSTANSTAVKDRYSANCRQNLDNCASDNEK